jgi:hypothetical protein
VWALCCQTSCRGALEVFQAGACQKATLPTSPGSLDRQTRIADMPRHDSRKAAGESEICGLPSAGSQRQRMGESGTASEARKKLTSDFKIIGP